MRRLLLFLSLIACRPQTVAAPEPGLEVLQPSTQLDGVTWVLALGEVKVGAEGRGHVSIGNRGTAPAAITQVAVRGGLRVEAMALPMTIEPAETVDVEVVVAPHQIGAVVAWVDVATDDPMLRAFSVKVTAAAVPGVIGAEKCRLVAAPAQVDFGAVPRGGFGEADVIVENSGTQSCSVLGVRAMGSSAFSVVAPQVPVAVLPAQTVRLRVHYVPSATEAGTLEVASDDPQSPLSIALAGHGVDPAACDVRIVPMALAFGRVAVGAGVPMGFEVWNFGTGACAQVDATSAELPVVFAAGPLAAGAKASGTVTVTTAALGPVTGTLTAGSAAAPITAAGAASQLCAVPPVLDFGAAAKDLPFELVNCGTATAVVRSVALDPGSAEEFSVQAAGGPFVLAPGEKVTASVRYAPADSSPHGGSASGLSSTLPNPVVTLRGNLPAGCTQVISCSPASLSFGSTPTSQTALRTFDCRNAGTSSLFVTQIYRAVGTSTDFTISPGPLPKELAPGRAMQVQVGFHPAAVGAQAGTLEVAHDGCGAARRIALSGTGAP